MRNARDLIETSVARVQMRVGAVLTEDVSSYDLTVEDDVLLGVDAIADVVRVGALIRRVVGHADQLEQERLPGADEPLPTFRGDLSQEATDGR